MPADCDKLCKKNLQVFSVKWHYFSFSSTPHIFLKLLLFQGFDIQLWNQKKVTQKMLLATLDRFQMREKTDFVKHSLIWKVRVLLIYSKFLWLPIPLKVSLLQTWKSGGIHILIDYTWRRNKNGNWKRSFLKTYVIRSFLLLSFLNKIFQTKIMIKVTFWSASLHFLHFFLNKLLCKTQYWLLVANLVLLLSSQQCVI